LRLPQFRGTSQALAFAPITQDVAEASSEPLWLWEGFLAPGAVTLLAGEPKVGKSTFVAALLGSIERAESFLGKATRRTGSIVITEERQDGLAEKARRFRLGDGVHRLRRDQRQGASWSQLVAEAVRYAHSNQLDILVIDTFAELAGLEGDEENDAGAVLKALRPLQEAADAGLAVLIVTHQRKSGGSFGRGVRGSSALVGAADVVISLDRSGSDGRVLKSISRFAATPDRLTVRLIGNEYLDAGASDAAKILRVLEQHGEVTAGFLSDQTGLSASTLNRRLERMGASVESRGSGTKNDPRKWSLAGSEMISTTPNP
jgi:KaiC/GvpD/RAD55 family RecA-like ATPase